MGRGGGILFPLFASLPLSVCGKGKYLLNQLNFIVKFILWIINDFLQVAHVATASPQIPPTPLYMYKFIIYIYLYQFINRISRIYSISTMHKDQKRGV